jgi:hypothetical protein
MAELLCPKRSLWEKCGPLICVNRLLLVLSHSSYHDIVAHSGQMWGKIGHQDDLARCASQNEFLDKLTISVVSNGKNYALGPPRIMHKYMVLW